MDALNHLYDIQGEKHMKLRPVTWVHTKSMDDSTNLAREWVADK